MTFFLGLRERLNDESKNIQFDFITIKIFVNLFYQHLKKESKTGIDSDQAPPAELSKNNFSRCINAPQTTQRAPAVAIRI